MYLQLAALVIVSGVALVIVLRRLLRTGDRHAERGHVAFSAGEFREAAAAFERALALPLKSHRRPELLASLGNAYEELGELERAEERHRSALELDPGCVGALTGLGIVLRLKGDLDQAEECYLKALRLNPDHACARASLGALYILRDDPQKAIQSLEKAIRLDPQLAVAHSNLALAYAFVGRFDEADEELRRAVVRGYRKAQEIKQRIDDLRELAGGESG